MTDSPVSSGDTLAGVVHTHEWPSWYHVRFKTSDLPSLYARALMSRHVLR